MATLLRYAAFAVTFHSRLNWKEAGLIWKADTWTEQWVATTIICCVCYHGDIWACGRLWGQWHHWSWLRHLPGWSRKFQSWHAVQQVITINTWHFTFVPTNPSSSLFKLWSGVWSFCDSCWDTYVSGRVRKWSSEISQPSGSLKPCSLPPDSRVYRGLQQLTCACKVMTFNSFPSRWPFWQHG